MFVGGKAERPSMAGGQGRGATKQVLGAEGEEGSGLVLSLGEGGSECGWR